MLVSGRGKDHEAQENVKNNQREMKNMNRILTVEESGLICIFVGESRGEAIEDMKRVLPYLDDTDMEELSHRVIGKLRNMADKDFTGLEFVAVK